MNNIFKHLKHIFVALYLGLILGIQASSTSKPQILTLENALENALANRLKFSLEIVQNSMNLVTQKDKQALEEKSQQIKNEVNPILAKTLIKKIKQANLTLNPEVVVQILVHRLNKQSKKKYTFKNTKYSVSLAVESIYQQTLSEVSSVLAEKYSQILKKGKKSENIILQNALDRALQHALEQVRRSTHSMPPKFKIDLVEKHQQIKNEINPLLSKEFIKEIKTKSNSTLISIEIAIQILAQRLSQQPNKKYGSGKRFGSDQLSLETTYKQILRRTSTLLEQKYTQILDRITKNINLE